MTVTNRILSALAASLVLATHSDAAANFEYLGISAETQIEELRERFPDSSFAHNSVQITELSSNGLVREVSVITAYVRLSFVPDASCERVIDSLIGENGPPDESEEFPVVATPTRQLVWRSAEENMLLRCYQKNSRFVAETLSFSNGLRALNSIIESVVASAESRNYVRLKALMAEDFLVSFGVGRSRDASLEWIRLKQPEILEEMLGIPKMTCEYVEYAHDQSTYYQCSGSDPNGYRAGFRRVDPMYWRFAWFVAGD